MMQQNIKRVVSCFIMTSNHHHDQPATTDTVQIAVFHRQSTMPTFPGHWAPCSGSIEKDETPFQAAQRELYEETNLEQAHVLPSRHAGLYVDVPYRETAIIRVYPFAVQIPHHWTLEMKGTEHDSYRFVSVSELENLQPAVPGLAQAFHHATHGQYLASTSPQLREWANDHTSGATTMAINALRLVAQGLATPEQVRMMRPSMVAISNAMAALPQQAPDQVIADMQLETDYVVQTARNAMRTLLRKRSSTTRKIATISRSSTLVAILHDLRQKYGNNKRIQIFCSQSLPGGEGELMARDVEGTVVEDDVLLEQIGSMDVLLVGADCVMPLTVINKVGTLALAQAAFPTSCHVYCCADRFKRWDDVFPPPMEDIFESVSNHLFDRILIPQEDDEYGENEENE